MGRIALILGKRFGRAMALMLLCGISARAVDVTLAWDANKEPNVRYRLYVGTSSRNYHTNYDAGSLTTFAVKNLSATIPYYFAATARNSAGLESDYSNEVIAVPRDMPSQLQGGVSANQFEISVRGLGGQTYSIQASDDLKAWREITSRTAGQDGQVTFQDAAFREVPYRFYRAVQR